MNQPYPSDLTRYQFDEFLAPLLPAPKPGGRPREVDMFAVINAILFVLSTGCQWRSLPHDYPNWSTVYTYFNQWRKNGIWEKIHDHLRMQVRVNEGRHPSPSAGICDAQSVKTGNPRIETTGFDGGKVISGIFYTIIWAESIYPTLGVEDFSPTAFLSPALLSWSGKSLSHRPFL